MNNEIWVLTITAASIGLVHTLLGPDHYLPFIVMSKARKWSIFKTIWVTAACGIGHVGSSIVLGILGIGLGIGLNKIENVESMRGDWAAWAFLLFGVLYFAWGIRRAILNKPHKHFHFHNGEKHVHEHTHDGNHDHIHDNEKVTNLTPWILFLIFVLGPCEPLVFTLIPAADFSTQGLILVISVFTIVTVLTMLTVVLLMSYGFKLVKLGKLERYTHAIAGGTVALCGILILIGL